MNKIKAKLYMIVQINLIKVLKMNYKIFNKI